MFKTVGFVYVFYIPQKKLPSSNVHILNENNVNTAFTYTCPIDSEIVVFRKEEWFKVLMHESFHNFALDFSDMNTDECTRNILNIFKVNSKVNLFEAYTEFWAEIMNAVFCSFYLQKENDDKKSETKAFENFLVNFDFFVNFERTYKFFQMIKTLNFMGLTYMDLISNSPTSQLLRDTLYKEDSNVLSYYIISTILMNNYQGFLLWCNEHNLSLLQFKKTTTNVSEFCKFIEKNYKTRTLFDSIECMQQFLQTIKPDTKKNKKSLDYILNNMRMTVCEMG